MLDRLMRRTVFPITHRIVSKDKRNRQLHNRRKPDRRPGVIAEDEKGPSEGTKLRERKTVHDRGHCMFSYHEVQIFLTWILQFLISYTLVCYSRSVCQSAMCGDIDVYCYI